MMAWVAFDRAVKLAESRESSADDEVKRWAKIRDEIHRQVCRRGYNRKVKAFTQCYGSDEMDASILMMPLVGFLPPTDERVQSTIEAVQRELLQDSFVLRYRASKNKVDGLPGPEGAFLPCSFWLANCLHLIGRTDEARELFERLLSLRNDLGLLSEEYDPVAKRQRKFPSGILTCSRSQHRSDPEQRDRERKANAARAFCETTRGAMSQP